MARGIFITGTDTGVGKTVVSAAMMHRFRGSTGLCYWKPVQTGIEQDDDTASVRALGSCSDEEVLARGIRLPRPLSPHLSARLADTRIEVHRLRELFALIPSQSASVVEGAGGVLVPLNETQLMADLMLALGLTVVVVARSGLGTINHSLLTIESLCARGLQVAGVVMVGDRNRDNREAIEHFARVPVIGEMPRFDDLTPQAVRAWAQQGLDPYSALLECIR